MAELAMRACCLSPRFKSSFPARTIEPIGQERVDRPAAGMLYQSSHRMMYGRQDTSNTAPQERLSNSEQGNRSRQQKKKFQLRGASESLSFDFGVHSKYFVHFQGSGFWSAKLRQKEANFGRENGPAFSDYLSLLCSQHDYALLLRTEQRTFHRPNGPLDSI